MVYLGALLLGSRPRKQDILFLTQLINNRLANWKTHYLSINNLLATWKTCYLSLVGGGTHSFSQLSTFGHAYLLDVYVRVSLGKLIELDATSFEVGVTYPDPNID